MKIKYLSLLLSIAFILTVQSGFAQLSPKIDSVIKQFGARINTDLQNDHLHGSISVAIIKKDQLIWSGAFGYAKMEKDVPADTGNVYRIGSITKTFTAVLLMQLVTEGKVKLDDPVENYLPEVKSLKGYNKDTKITFRQLASHTSGLNREPDVKGADVVPLDKWEEKTLDCISKTSFRSKPGEQFWYCNIGYAILGIALSRATGVPYMKMIQQRIFNPLHMSSSSFSLPDDQLPRLAEGMSNQENTINTAQPLQELKGRGYKVPNGGIYSTPQDIAKFAMALMGYSNLLDAQTLKQMQQVAPGGDDYGLGLLLYKDQYLNVIGHDGSIPGYTAEMDIEQASGYAVILMRNYNNGNTKLTAVTHQLLRALKQAD